MGKEDRINLLEETMEKLHENGKIFDDVRYIVTSKGSYDCYMGEMYDKYRFIPKELFLKIADINYDSGFGCIEIDESLKIVGDDWWLERHEYDGSEWWVFKTYPALPKKEIDEDYKIYPNPERNYKLVGKDLISCPVVMKIGGASE